EVFAVVVNLQGLFADRADIVDAVFPVTLNEQCLQHGAVAGLIDGGVGNEPDKPEVLESHMGAAVVFRGNSGVGAEDLDIQFGIGQGNEKLVQRRDTCEVGQSMHQWA